MADGLAAFPAYSYRDDEAVLGFPDDKKLIVFDGVCVLCNGSAQFVLRHDAGDTFRFTHAQSPLGQALYRHYGLDAKSFETVLLIEHGRAYGKLDAAIRIARALDWPWRVLSVLRALPSSAGNFLYDAVARNRYRLFGRHQACLVPTPALRARFIE